MKNTIMTNNIGEDMMMWASDLFPICRSITGNGLRKTLKYINDKSLQVMNIHEIQTNTQVFDWRIPKEWNITDAWVKNSMGKKVVDFSEHNLHIVNYSVPIHKKIQFKELNEHLFSLPNQPNAIPYITSYYKEAWGFCITDMQRKELKDEEYEVFIDSELTTGALTYGDIIIQGETDEEILLSTYVCHPSMANNELSGPVVTLALVNWLYSLPKRKYTYRIVFVPETIGAIAYLNENIAVMQKRTKAGFVITCVGDNLTYSFMPSRTGETLADKVAKLILNEYYPNYKAYSFLQRGSDERQYCSPNVDLPVASIMRSKYGEYDQYHTSLDDLSFISKEGLTGSLEVYQACINLLEHNAVYKSLIIGEPQLGKRNLYSSLGIKDNENIIPRNLLNFLAYTDGLNDLIKICDITGIPSKEVIFYAEIATKHQLIKKVSSQ